MSGYWRDCNVISIFDRPPVALSRPQRCRRRRSEDRRRFAKGEALAVSTGAVVAAGLARGCVRPACVARGSCFGGELLPSLISAMAYFKVDRYPGPHRCRGRGGDDFTAAAAFCRFDRQAFCRGPSGPKALALTGKVFLRPPRRERSPRPRRRPLLWRWRKRAVQHWLAADEGIAVAQPSQLKP
jgi:hypothetical protein